MARKWGKKKRSHRRQSSGPGREVSPDCAILRGFLAKEKSEWHPLEHKDGKTWMQAASEWKEQSACHEEFASNGFRYPNRFPNHPNALKA